MGIVRCRLIDPTVRPSVIAASPIEAIGVDADERNVSGNHHQAASNRPALRPIVRK
jgi:hypothetical protein